MGRDRKVYRHVNELFEQHAFTAHLGPIEVGLAFRTDARARQQRFFWKVFILNIPNRTMFYYAPRVNRLLRTTASVVSSKMTWRSIFRFSSRSRNELRLLFTAWISCHASDMVEKLYPSCSGIHRETSPRQSLTGESERTNHTTNDTTNHSLPFGGGGTSRLSSCRYHRRRYCGNAVTPTLIRTQKLECLRRLRDSNETFTIIIVTVWVTTWKSNI